MCDALGFGIYQESDAAGLACGLQAAAAGCQQ